MKTLITLTAATALLSLAACSSPEGEDTADMAPEATTADVGGEQPVGDGGAPEMINVQAAIDEACPTLDVTVKAATCTAIGLGQEFSCEYSFEQDPEDTERELTINRGDDGPDWDVAEDPEFCGSLDRANMQADTAE